MPIWVGRDGSRLNAETAKSLLQDPNHYIVHEFDNEAVKVTLRWKGRVDNPGNMLPEYWPVFVLDVMNYDEAGNLTPDPVSNGQTFGNEKAGVAAYQKFLSSWTDSAVDHNGVFKEVGNVLVPPPPPNPDTPQSQPMPGDVIGSEGAW